MSNIPKDVNAVWSRLFDHKAFLRGEIQFTLREFEQKRSDKEVEKLFSILESITDIKDTQIDRLKQSIHNTLPKTNADIGQALILCDSIKDIELKYKHNTTLEIAREDRKQEWQKFVDDMSHNCKRIDNAFEEKEEELQEFYRDLEKKLHLT